MLTWVANSHRKIRGRQPLPTFQTKGLTYHYTLAGNGPTLLLLHGFTGSAENWAPLTTALSGSYRLLALDLPGHGRTEAPDDPARYAMEAVARDVDSMLDHLQASPAHLLGYSMGGRLALYLALHRPRRWTSLILESASPGLATAAERTRRAQKDEALADFIEREGLPAFVDRWQALPLFASQKRLPQDVRQAHREARLHNRPRGLANSLRGMGTGVQPSLWPRLGQLALPVLLITGELDEKFVAIAQEMAAMTQEMGDEQPRPHLEIVPDAGHTVHLERPDYYEHLLRRWLSEQD